MPRHLLEIDDLSRDELATVLALAEDPNPPQALAGLGAALLFEKPSARTRNSMEMAVVQLGGHPVTIRGDEVGIDTRESAEDITRVLQSYHAVIAARVYDHRLLERMAAVSRVPIVNLLSDLGHPMQALADVLTIKQLFGDLAGRRVAYVGDGNNVCRSLVLAAGLSGMEVAVGAPVGYQPPPADRARFEAAGLDVFVTSDPAEAVAGADIVYTDAWYSMGQEAEANERRPVFRPYQVNAELMAGTATGGAFLHCLPAHRGDEVTDEVLDSPASHVWQQAENRMHAAARFAGVDRGAGLMARPEATRMGKPQRQHLVTKLIEANLVRNQMDLVELLAAEGVVATQATVSRDLEDLGAIKVRVPGGESAYAIPELPKAQVAPEDHLRRVFGDWVVEVAHSGNLVVLRTPPGSAHVVGSALDRAGLPDILGTVAGDDTLIVVAAEDTGGAAVAAELADLAGL